MATTDQVRDCVYNYTSHARRGVDAIESFITEDPILQEAEQVSAALEDVRTALSRVEELVHGDLSQQAARWLDEPATRTTLEKAVWIAGVGGTVRRYREPVTWLSKTYRVYEATGREHV